MFWMHDVTHQFWTLVLEACVLAPNSAWKDIPTYNEAAHVGVKNACKTPSERKKDYMLKSRFSIANSGNDPLTTWYCRGQGNTFAPLKPTSKAQPLVPSQTKAFTKVFLEP